MPNWKKVIVSGSDAHLSGLSVDGNASITGSLNVYKSGSTVFSVQGSQGTLFEITDSLSGSLFSVSDISGIPILEVFSDDTVKIGTHNNEAIIVNGDTAIISGSLTGSLNLDNVVNAGTDTDKFLVLDSGGNVDFRTGTEVYDDIGVTSLSSSIASDISSLQTSIDSTITPIQLVTDTKLQSSGYLAWFGISDIQSNPDRAYTTWIAPTDGYLDEVIISPESGNPTADDIDLALYVDGTQQSSTVSVLMAAAGTNKTFTFGSSNYSFTAGERLSLSFDKNTNTSDIYNVMVKFRLDN